MEGVIVFDDENKGKIKVTVEVEINEYLIEMIRKYVKSRLSRQSDSNQEEKKEE